jgi:DNA-binding winged helix-turn-helix (wHTH) protein
VNATDVLDLMEESPKEIAARLHRLEEKLRLLLRHISGVTWTTDADLRITSIEGQAMQQLDIPSRKRVGQSIHEAGTDDDEGVVLSTRALEGEVLSAEQWWGGQRVIVTVEPLRDSGGDIIGTMGFAVLLDQVDQADELRAIRAALQEARFEAAGYEVGSVLELGSLVISPAAFAAWKAGEILQLSPTEFRLLLLLANNEGTTMSRERMLRTVWGYDYLGESRLVDMTVSRLRQKLKQDPPAHVTIKTVRGVGYRLLVEEPKDPQEEASADA